MTLVSHAAISSCVIARPNLGPSTRVETVAHAPSASAAAMPANLSVSMFHLPFAIDRPTGDGVVVLVLECGWRWRRVQFAALGHKLGTCRLRIAGVIPCTALQYRRP